MAAPLLTFPSPASPGFATLRRHAAVARTLLDELDRLGRRALDGSSLTRDDRVLVEQIAEELARLASRMSASVALAAREAADPRYPTRR